MVPLSGQKGGKEQSRDRASTPEGAAEPAAHRTGVLPAHPRSRDPSSDPWNQGNLHCLLPVPSSTEGEENCGAKVYSKCLKRKGDDSMSEFQATDTGQHYPYMQTLL